MNVTLYYHNSFNTAVEKNENKKEKRDERALIDLHTVLKSSCLQPSIPQDNLLSCYHTDCTVHRQQKWGETDVDKHFTCAFTCFRRKFHMAYFFGERGRGERGWEQAAFLLRD